MAGQDEKVNQIGSNTVKMSKAHISNHYLQACIRGAQRLGYNAASLLDTAGIPIECLNQPQQQITEQQLTRLIKTVWRTTKDEFMGLAPQPCNNGIFALMAEFCLSAKTLGAMLKRSARFYSAVYHEVDIELEEPTNTNEELVFFRLNLKDSQYDPDHLLQEFMLLMWQRFGGWLVDQQLPVAITQFNYSPPAHAQEYRAMYCGEHKFAQPSCGFYLHRRFLHLPIVRREVELIAFLRESPAYILHRHNQDFSLRTKIRLMLSQYDYTAMPSLGEIGKKLHITPRSIARKLKNEGTSFSKIKASLRQEYAIKVLTTEHFSINEISEQLGFSETASFCRAFKKWTGCAPSVWNREQKRPYNHQ